MRVILCVHSLRRGGAERVVLELASGLMEKGHEVLVTPWVDLDEHNEDRYRTVAREYLTPNQKYRWPISAFQAAGKFRQLLKRFRPDVIAIHNPALCWVVALARPAMPTVHVLHGYGWITPDGSFKKKVIHVLDRVFRRWLKPHIMVVSAAMTQAAARYYHVTPRLIRTVPNGIDLDAFAAGRVEVPVATNILMVGTINANKGQHLALEAIGRLKAKLPDATLTIVGDGPDRATLEQKVREMGEGESIRFLGRREDVPALMAQATALWQLSRTEAHPLTVLEAMAAGVPVIGFDVEGVREAVVDGKTGFLVDYGDLDVLVGRTLEIVGDKALRVELSRQARRLARAEYGLQAMVSRHERLLTDALAN